MILMLISLNHSVIPSFNLFNKFSLRYIPCHSLSITNFRTYFDPILKQLLLTATRQKSPDLLLQLLILCLHFLQLYIE